jgi:hypothetical protein
LKGLFNDETRALRGFFECLRGSSISFVFG